VQKPFIDKMNSIDLRKLMGIYRISVKTNTVSITTTSQNNHSQ